MRSPRNLLFYKLSPAVSLCLHSSSPLVILVSLLHICFSQRKQIPKGSSSPNILRPCSLWGPLSSKYQWSVLLQDNWQEIPTFLPNLVKKSMFAVTMNNLTHNKIFLQRRAVGEEKYGSWAVITTAIMQQPGLRKCSGLQNSQSYWLKLPSSPETAFKSSLMIRSTFANQHWADC